MGVAGADPERAAYRGRHARQINTIFKQLKWLGDLDFHQIRQCQLTF
jgi:hypothetical protein